MVKPTTAAALKRVRNRKTAVADSIDTVETGPSLTTQLVELLPFETYSRAEFIEPALLHLYSSQGSQWKEQHRNVVQSAVGRAKKASGNDYRVEIVETLTPGRNFYIVVLITRTC